MLDKLLNKNYRDITQISSDIVGKTLSLIEIANYMEEAGYESIMPVDEMVLNETGLIWYPFEPFMSQINIWVDFIKEDKYLIQDVQLLTDVE